MRRPTMKKKKANKAKMALTCHQCTKKRFTRIEEPYFYEKEVNSQILIFKAKAVCDKCGYVHGELVDMKEKPCE